MEDLVCDLSRKISTCRSGPRVASLKILAESLWSLAFFEEPVKNTAALVPKFQVHVEHYIESKYGEKSRLSHWISSLFRRSEAIASLAEAPLGVLMPAVLTRALCRDSQKFNGIECKHRLFLPQTTILSRVKN